jgi:hypothetical protein
LKAEAEASSSSEKIEDNLTQDGFLYGTYFSAYFLLSMKDGA